MQRRKVLLGSGAGLATVLAGCSGEDLMSGDDDENGDENNGEKPNEPGEGNGNGGDDGKKDEKDEKDEKDDKDKGNRDVPGVDVDAFESLLEQRGIRLETIRHSGPNLTIEVSIADLNTDQFDGSSRDELEDRFLDIVDAATDTVTDAQAFIASVETVTVSILDENARKGKEKTGLTLEVRVSWLLEFARNERSEEELLDRITEIDAEDE